MGVWAWHIHGSVMSALTSSMISATDMCFYLNCRYHKYNEVARRVESGYPKAKAGPWMGPTCTDDGSYQWK